MLRLLTITDSIHQAVNQQLSLILGEDLPILRDLKNFIIQSGGKRVRPLLLVLLSWALGRKNEEVMALAAITEIIHAASLLHDDVIDGATERRGQPSGRVLFGNHAVILGGDYLLACGIERLNRFQDPRQMAVFTKVIKNLAVAELLQREYAGRADITLNIYQRIIYGKTAALFEAAAISAGLYAQQTNQTLQNLELLGRTLGILFQIRDDTLDYFKANLLKKPAFTDYENGLYTYPILELRERVNPKERQELASFMELPLELRRDPQIQQKLLAFLKEHQCEEHCIAKINELKEITYRALAELPAIAKEYLEIIAEQIEKLTDF